MLAERRIIGKGIVIGCNRASAVICETWRWSNGLGSSQRRVVDALIIGCRRWRGCREKKVVFEKIAFFNGFSLFFFKQPSSGIEYSIAANLKSRF